MIIRKENITNCQLTINQTPIERVSKYTYLDTSQRTMGPLAKDKDTHRKSENGVQQNRFPLQKS